MRCASVPESEPRPHRVSLFTILFAAWLSLQLGGRWMKWTLFHGHGVYGWARPEGGEIALLIASTLVPALLCALLVDLLSRTAANKRKRSWILGLGAFAVLTWTEFDVAWVHVSRQHIGWREIHMFFSESWSNHFGLRPSDVVRQVGLLAAHGVAIVIMLAIARKLDAKTVASKAPRLTWALALLIGLFLLDSHYVARQRAAEALQWVELSDRHPLRWRALDAAWPVESARNRELAPARASLDAAIAALDAQPESATQNPHACSDAVPALTRVEDIVVIVVESWNPDYIDAESMPFYSSLRSGGLNLERHYSTGNCTHYGVLGLLFGSPVTFYRGVEGEEFPSSPWISALNEEGFITRYLGSDLTSFRHMGEYMENFSLPHVETQEEELIGALGTELERAERSFTLVFYGETHYPWPHRSEFDSFRPEVPDDFDYNAWNVQMSADEIVRRYRNALRQLDDWLERICADINLDRTLLVITGDHGEEFFERGRLAHGSSLDEPQIRTPALLIAPGLEPGNFSAVSSHADLLPTLLDLCGLNGTCAEAMTDAPAGRSLFDPTAPRVAVSSHNEHTRPPLRWIVVSEEEKIELEGSRGTELILRDLRDLNDLPLGYETTTERWTLPMEVAARLARTLRGVGL